MKFGCCVNMLPGAETLAGIAYARPLKELGYDYIELPMSRLAALEERDFETVRDTLADLDLPCRACNDFMPARFQIVGEETTPEAELEAYLIGAFDRLERLGSPSPSSAAPGPGAARRDFPGRGPWISSPTSSAGWGTWPPATGWRWRSSTTTAPRPTC